MRAGVLGLLVWVAAGPAYAELSGLPCQASDALSEVAALLLLEGRAPTAESLQQAADEAGHAGAPLHATTMRGDAEVARWLTGLRHREDAQMACGEALGAERRVVVAAARAGELSLRDGLLVGSLGPGFSQPRLVFLGRDGRPRPLSVTQAALRRGVTLPVEHERAVRVQLVATGPSGPRPVAGLDLVTEVAGSSMEGQAPRPAATGGGASSEEELWIRLSDFRRELGVPSLRGNALLRRSAQRHARRVCELGQVAHRLGREDDPVRRLRRERIEARAVGEAIARSRNAQGALSAIFDSPSHRLAVTEPRFTDAGIGHARDSRGRSCVVVLLAAWPRRVP